MRQTKEQQEEVSKFNEPTKQRSIELYKEGITNKSRITRLLQEDGYKLHGSNNFYNVRQKVVKWIEDFTKNTGELDHWVTDNKALLEECQDVGIDTSKVTQAWYKGKHWSINFMPSDHGPSFQEMYDDHLQAVSTHTFNYEKIERPFQSDPHLLVIDPADVHIGKLATKNATGEEYNTEEAVRRVKEGIDKILSYTSTFEIDKVLFVAGNDILPTDNTKKSTTRGTIQDTSGMWYDNYLTAKDLYIDCLENLMQVADVHYMFNPSNHDYMAGFYLSDNIKSWFKSSENITFSTDLMYRKYFKYGKNLIGTTHGDGAKQQNLGSLMSVEAREYWADTIHKYFYVHHVHHKTAKDYINVTVESLRSPSTTDVWHSQMGYVSPQAIEGYLHHPDKGQVARYTYTF